MSIIQISKLQVRSGNLVDLPQLDNAEFGWASDEKKLYIGKTEPGPNENVEVLTSYSNISFSQLAGSTGNLNIVLPEDGQILAYDGSEWVNKGGDAGGLVTLGDVADVKLDGGATGYVLETDGAGNLNWTPKYAAVAYINNITKASPAVVTTVDDNFFVNGSQITITNVEGMTQLNGLSYFVDVLSSNTFGLYTDSSLSTPVNSSSYTTYTENGRAISAIGGSGAASSGGSNTQIQYNFNNLLAGDSDFTYDFVTNQLTLNGNANVGNLNSTSTVTAGRFVGNGSALTSLNASNVTTGTLALARLANSNIVINGTTAALGSTVTVTANTAQLLTLSNNGLGNTSGTTFNGGTAQTISYNSIGAPSTTGTNATGTWAISVTGAASTSGTVTTNAQPNITSVGTLSSVAVTGNATAGNVYANSGTIGASLLTGTLTTAAQPNITRVGTLANLAVTGNITTTSITTGANTTAGTITGNWSLSSGSRLQSTYADLAEYYESDAQYEPGTVLEFGGEKEVTLAQDGTTRVAGVVSTNPAYAMNQCCKGIAVAIALQGRVPTKVRGTIRKGDMMVSGGDGFARPWNNPHMGTVIGKALENFDGIEGVIEVAVGRL